MTKTPQITVIGYAGREEYQQGDIIPEYSYKCAEEVGRLIGKNRWYLVTGAESGIMEKAAKGAKCSGGITIGVMNGQNRGKSNSYTDIEVITNTYVTSSTPILIAMADIVVVCGGGAGTLQEITIAYRLNKPIIIIEKTGGWADRIVGNFLDERQKFPLLRVKNAQECIEKCNEIIMQIQAKGGENNVSRKLNSTKS